ncbi:TPA: tRNA epoxyqueuosine(34) reductase QueG [Candidatus Sumerlaeota bacterium]|jgi:epoxyqueuosine reductase|nr:tRNA epoxyqueuosine(34) reductase QueG [Candidatus Sumerlaeota bacterium]
MKRALRNVAKSLGIPVLGVAVAQPLTEDMAYIRAACDEGCHAAMEWLPRSLDVRADPQRVLPGAQSVVMVAWPVAEKKKYQAGRSHPTDLPNTSPLPEGRIARYAAGRDYHIVLQGKLNELAAPLRAVGAAVRVFVDAAPMLERGYAQKAGLGFVGKNNCLIHPVFGSWFLLGGLLTTLKLPEDAPLPNGCGECRRCLDACPGRALIRPYCLDARKCLSYWTVENRGAWPEDVRANVGDRLFGCDACQEACPYNWESTSPRYPLADVLAIVSNREFEGKFKDTAFLRLGRRGLLRNALVVAAHLKRGDLIPRIRALAENPQEHEVVRETACWALQTLETASL